jgi:hypothetical protein
MSSFAIAVEATGAGRIGDTKLIGMEEESICIRDIKLLFLSHEAGSLARECLHKPLAERCGEVIELFFREMGTKGILALKSFQIAAMAMLDPESSRQYSTQPEQ